MYASELIQTLNELVQKHGDKEMTVVIPPWKEYSLRGPTLAKEGPLQNVGDHQNQSPPARFVFEVKDDL